MCDMGLLRHIRATRAPFIEMTNEQLEMEWNLNKKDNLLFAKALLSRQAAMLAALMAEGELAIIKEKAAIMKEEAAIIKEERQSKKRRHADNEEEENTRKTQLKQKAEFELKLLLEKVDLLLQTIDYLSMHTNPRVFRPNDPW